MPKRPSTRGRNFAASSKERSKPVAMSGHAAVTAARAAMAATSVASQRNGESRQNATLALAALPNGRIRIGSAPISRIACTLFSRPSTHNAAAGAIASGRTRPALRPATIRISSAKMTGQAASSSLRRIRECTATPPENAKAKSPSSRPASRAPRGGSGRRKSARSRSRSTGPAASGANRAGHGRVEAGDVRCRRNGG